MRSLDKFIDRAGDWNAQFSREIKGRCTPTSLIGVFISSFLMQLLVLVVAWLSNSSYIDRYDWGAIWNQVFQSLTWLSTVILGTGGTYLLASDLYQENQRGTLNFIRLSPQSGLSIMGGKLLGVPILAYSFVVLAVPLQLWAGCQSQIGFVNTVLWDGLILSICGLMLLLTIFWMTLVQIRPIGLTALNLFLSTSAVNISGVLLETLTRNSNSTRGIDYFRWFYIPLNNLPALCILGIGTILIACYWLWEPIDRRYLNHHSTLLSKKSSYQLNCCCQIWFLGFALMIQSQTGLQYFLMPIGLLQIIGIWSYFSILTPSRRILQDWSRYRRERVDRKWHWGSPDLLRDLLWEDRSPASLAIAVNLGICVVPWLPFVWQATHPQQFNSLLSICLGTIITFNYGTMFQMLGARKRLTIFGSSIVVSTFWAMVIGMLLVLLTILAMLGYGGLIITMMVCFTPLAIFNPATVPITVPVAGLLLATISQLFIGQRLLHAFQKQVSVLGRWC